MSKEAIDKLKEAMDNIGQLEGSTRIMNETHKLLRQAIALLKKEPDLEAVNRELQYDKNAITKIWKILGVENYEQAQGKSVDELVAGLEAENKRLKEGLYLIRKSTEIMEARRLADDALKGEKDDDTE